MPAVAAGSAGASGARAPRVSAFWSRILVAAVALPVVLGLVWLGGWWVLGLAAVAGAIALHEYFAMIRELRPPALAGFVGLGLGLLGERLGGLEWMLGGVLVSLPLAFVLHAVARTRGGATVAIASTFLGAAWIGLGLGHLLLLRDLPDNGRLAAFTVILTVFAADTAAYFVGRLLGRRKLAPTLSPGKTWEGFVAGVAVALFVTFISLYRTGFVDGWRSLVLGAAIALTAVAGDLFESALKRDMHVKDSGRLLAGHGGMLDRLDALLFAWVAAYYVIVAFGAA
jgi:phosphatidate cytidylyltransferase